MLTFNKFAPKYSPVADYPTVERIKPSNEQIDWMVVHAKPGNFADSLYSQYKAKGGLTAKQLAKIEESLHPAPIVGVSVAGKGMEKVEAALHSAKAHGLKKPGLRLGDFLFKLAPATGKNPGAIYVTEGEVYLGKIFEGEFFPMTKCDADRLAYIKSICADPEAAAVAYGKMTGNCACCGKTLSDPKSIALGIGPVCKVKYFGK